MASKILFYIGDVQFPIAHSDPKAKLFIIVCGKNTCHHLQFEYGLIETKFRNLESKNVQK